MTIVHNMHLLQDHYKECAEYPIKCERCSSEVKKSRMDDHLEEHCPIIECLCGEQVGLRLWEIPWDTPSHATSYKFLLEGLSLGLPLY